MLAVIGGTGFGEYVGIERLSASRVDTEYGSVELQFGELQGNRIVFLARHGRPAVVPPHKINYRANIRALVQGGATAVIAVTAVGSVDPTLPVPCLVIPDQVIDYTSGREHTFFDRAIHHIDFTFPYHNGLRDTLVRAVHQGKQEKSSIEFRAGGTYACTQGPRLETAAEIRRLRGDGCSIVGMTAMPEACLARELDLPYAGISLVVNPGAGMGGAAVDLNAIQQVMDTGMGWMRFVLALAIADYCAGGASGAGGGV